MPTCPNCNQRRQKKTIDAVHVGRHRRALSAKMQVVACGCACGVAPEYLPLVDADLRGRRGLLTGAEIRKQRYHNVGRKQKSLSDLLGVSQTTVSRWERCEGIQSRSEDILMRLIFASENVRKALKTGDFEKIVTCD